MKLPRGDISATWRCQTSVPTLVQGGGGEGERESTLSAFKSPAAFVVHGTGLVPDKGRRGHAVGNHGVLGRKWQYSPQ